MPLSLVLQAALGAVPLNMALELGLSEDYIRWGHLIKASNALSVAIFATVGVFAIEKLAPVLLKKEVSGRPTVSAWTSHRC